MVRGGIYANGNRFCITCHKVTKEDRCVVCGKKTRATPRGSQARIKHRDSRVKWID